MNKQWNPSFGPGESMARGPYADTIRSVCSMWRDNATDIIYYDGALRNVHINVKDYKAAGNGIDDDTDAIQATVNAGAGGYVIFPTGTYNISGITVPDNTTLVGLGKVTLFLIAGSNISLIRNVDPTGGNTNIIIKDLELDCNGANQTGSPVPPYKSGVLFDNVSDSKILNVDVKYSRTSGIQLLGAENILVQGCLLTMTYEDGIAPNLLSKKITIDNCSFIEEGTSVSNHIEIQDGTERVLISNCTLEGAQYGIRAFTHDDPPGLLGNEHIGIKNCTLTKYRDYGIAIMGANAGARNVSIIGNVFDNTVAPASGNYDGAVYLNNDVQNVNIIGNAVWADLASPGNAIKIESDTGGDPTHVTITGNTLFSNQAGGIGIGLERALEDIVISGNIIEGYTYGVNFDADVGEVPSNISILNNHIQGVTYAIRRGGGVTLDKTTRVKDNVLSSPGSVFSPGTIGEILAQQNAGFVTENSGTGSITSGGTSDTITHGLAVTPTVDDISITLAENPTNTPGAIWVDTITSSEFNVNCENDPGASNLDFGWKAIVL